MDGFRGIIHGLVYTALAAVTVLLVTYIVMWGVFIYSLYKGTL